MIFMWHKINLIVIVSLKKSSNFNYDVIYFYKPTLNWIILSFDIFDGLIKGAKLNNFANQVNLSS